MGDIGPSGRVPAVRVCRLLDFPVDSWARRGPRAPFLGDQLSGHRPPVKVPGPPGSLPGPDSAPCGPTGPSHSPSSLLTGPTRARPCEPTIVAHTDAHTAPPEHRAPPGVLGQPRQVDLTPQGARRRAIAGLVWAPGGFGSLSGASGWVTRASTYWLEGPRAGVGWLRLERVSWPLLPLTPPAKVPAGPSPERPSGGETEAGPREGALHRPRADQVEPV